METQESQKPNLVYSLISEREFENFWHITLNNLQITEPCVDNFLFALKSAKKIRKHAPELSMRIAINQCVRQTLPILQENFVKLLPQMQANDISKTLELLYDFDLTFNTKTFNAIDAHIQTITAQTDITILHELTHHMAQHSYAPSNALLTHLRIATTPEFLLNAPAKLRQIARATTLFNVLSNSATPLNDIVASTLNTQANSLNDNPTKLAALARDNFQAAWFFGITPLTQALHTHPAKISDITSMSEKRLRNYFKRHATTLNKNPLHAIGKQPDITLQIHDTIVNIDLDGHTHFLHSPSHIYNGRTLLMAHISTLAYPNQVFIQLPFTETLDKRKISENLTAHLEQEIAAKRLPNGRPLIVQNAGYKVKLASLNSAHAFLRPQ